MIIRRYFLEIEQGGIMEKCHASPNGGYLACGVVPPEFSYQQRRKLRTDCRFYIWDDPLLFRKGADMIIRRCVPEIEQGGVMGKWHASPNGGHFAGDRTTHKILQSGFLLAYSIQRLF